MKNFIKICQHSNFRQNQTKVTGALHEAEATFNRGIL
jgi:hypothetical protein